MRLFDVLSNFSLSTIETIYDSYFNYDIYELSHKLLKDLRLRILENNQLSEICLNLRKWWPSSQYRWQNENLFNASKKLCKNRNYIFPVVNYVTWKLELVSDVLWMIVSGNIVLLLTHPRPLKGYFFDNFVTLRFSSQF